MDPEYRFPMLGGEYSWKSPHDCWGCDRDMESSRLIHKYDEDRLTENYQLGSGKGVWGRMLHDEMIRRGLPTMGPSRREGTRESVVSVLRSSPTTPFKVTELARRVNAHLGTTQVSDGAVRAACDQLDRDGIITKMPWSPAAYAWKSAPRRRPDCDDRHVLMYLRDEGQTELDADAIRIKSKPRCKHVETVCGACAEQWQEDWVIVWDSSQGARFLQKMMNRWLAAHRR